ncbi:hypothetical protein PV367_21715 [Streptomyces europaeiscabiei]|uniref:Uncharacterized protein n=1 Tax=Streptomyces europaeiscabiei TaxID=146819 RepID=A0AAJ2PSI0_9ACTN|nr:hypothetical protein [Streptomyces europaeiscabiei]MDX3132351.1 hypothetical protein [Streptomyces europaeiscabiei]
MTSTSCASRCPHTSDAPRLLGVDTEVFEAGDETAKAAEWFTAGVTHALGVGLP